MEILSNTDWKMLDSLMSGTLSRERFDADFNIVADFEACLNILLELKIKKDYRKFEHFFWALPKQMTSLQELLLFRMALVEEWHFEHEEIVSAFQTSMPKDFKNILFLKFIIENVPQYLSIPDLKDAFIRKCAYAIAAQPAPYNEEALRELSQSSDEVIKKYALHQLVKNGFDT